MSIEAVIQHAFGRPADSMQPVGGGCINNAMRVQLGSEVFFVKWKADAKPFMFASEAYALRLLQKAGEIRVPDVIAEAEADEDHPAYLVLEWIDSIRHAAGAQERLGRQLAALHRHTSERYGLQLEDFEGEYYKPVTPTDDWVTFFRDRRIGWLVERGHRLGTLRGQRAVKMDALLKRIDLILEDVERQPSLLHGDLWGGNYMIAADGAPVLIDPQSYYGDREIELAYTALFGGFSREFYAAYHEVYPIQPGYEGRRPLYQLYHLLEHLNLFGESYGGAVDEVLRFYVG